MGQTFATRRMKIWWLTFVAVASATGQALAQDAPPLTGDKDKLSYALGMDLGHQLRRLSVDVDPGLFGKGLGDGLAGGKTLMTEEEARAVIATLQDEMKRREIEKARAQVPQTGKAGKVKPADEKTK